jgi:hypothetical protein
VTPIVQRWLGKHPRLQVLHGARYSPHDNPVERMLTTAAPHSSPWLPAGYVQHPRQAA